MSLSAALGRLEEATEIHTGDAFLEALQMSHGDLANLLRMALKADAPNQNTYIWVRDVYDDYVVYEATPKDDVSPSTLYQRSYSILDGKVTFGDAVKVVAVTQYVPVEEAERQPSESDRTDLTGDLVPLIEKAVKQDGTATIKIIQAGQGSSGWYPEDVLKRDGPKAFVAGTHIYLDHPSVSEESDRPERSVKDLAGSLTGPAEWKEDGLYAPVTFIDAVAPHVNAIAAISGMSIRASGTVGEREVDGKKVRSIESIDAAHSVDIVTKPGAGGKVLDLIEAARNGYTPAGVSAPTTMEVDQVDKAAFEEAQKELAEARKQIGELETWKTDQERRAAEAALIREAHKVVVETLAKETLPAPTRERLAGQLASDPPVKDGALDREALVAKVTEAAKAEVDYLASVTEGTGKVTGMGGSPPTNPETPKLEESEARIEAALKGL